MVPQAWQMTIRSFGDQEWLDEKGNNVLFMNILFDETAKKIINFSVIQFFRDSNGKKHQVIKFDFSNGCYNIHRYYLGETNRTEMNHIELTPELYREAKNIVRQNWKDYSLKFRVRYFPDELKGEH